MISFMKEKEENIIGFDELYDILKNHPYVNEITIHNGLSFHDEYSKIYAYIYSLGNNTYKDPWNIDNKHFIIPELALLSIEGHDINMMYTALNGQEDGCEINKIHHKYMMEILDIIASLTENGPKKEYINIWKKVRIKEGGWKWRTYLYKAIEQVAHVYKDGHYDYSYVGVNCIRESKVDYVINRYKETIKWELENNNEYVSKLYQNELDDIINRTNLYHIILPDDEYVKNFISYE